MKKGGKAGFKRKFCLMALAVTMAACSGGGGQSDENKVAADTRPNVLIILADDLGYSDIGAFGSEIETPNLDALAAEGRILTNMHAAAACSPTRAMLLSGADHHLVGLGQMAEYVSILTAAGSGMIPTVQNSSLYHPFGVSTQFGALPEGYTGYLNDRALSMPEIFRDNGYSTYMAGKWHLAYEPGLTSTPGLFWNDYPAAFPKAKGFERSFVLLAGGASHFMPERGKESGLDMSTTYLEDDVPLSRDDLPDDFYSSNFYTDKLIEYIGEKQSDRKPFLAYAAYTAPHWPLHAPQADIDAQKGKYDDGYEKIRARRIAKMKRLGILPEAFQENPGLPSVQDGGTGKKTWDELTPEERAYQARLMEVYAAQVSNMDQNIGRLLQHLKDIGEYDNTVIVFMSDNGPEGAYTLGSVLALGADHLDNSIDNLGKPLSLADYGERWAEVSATPFRLWKTHTGAEGATSVPAIVKMPQQKGGYEKLDALVHVTDILPTVLDLAGIDDPGTRYGSRTVHPISGVSLASALAQPQNTEAVREESAVLADELFFNSYVKKGKWKLSRNQEVLDNGVAPGSPLVPFTELPWALFDMASDRGETKDLAAEHPEVVAELLAEWDRYVLDNNVLMMKHTFASPRDPAAP